MILSLRFPSTDDDCGREDDEDEVLARVLANEELVVVRALDEGALNDFWSMNWTTPQRIPKNRSRATHSLCIYKRLKELLKL